MAASLVACFQTIGGEPLRKLVREATTPLAGKGKFKRVVLEAAKYAVARYKWACILTPVDKLHKDVARNFTARRLKMIMDTAGPDLVWRLLTQKPVRPSNATDTTKPALFSALNMSPHLARLLICLTPGMAKLGPYLVVKCRALTKAVPSRTPGATRAKWRKIHGNALETAANSRDALEGAVEDSAPR